MAAAPRAAEETAAEHAADGHAAAGRSRGRTSHTQKFGGHPSGAALQADGKGERLWPPGFLGLARVDAAEVFG